MLADSNKVIELIPQKHPMVMVDGLISSDETTTISKLSIIETNIFCSDGHFQVPGLLENIAQTAALRSGYEAWKNKVIPKIGFLGSIKNVSIMKLPADKDILLTKLTIMNLLTDVLIIKGEIFVENTLMAQGEMNIFLQ